VQRKQKKSKGREKAVKKSGEARRRFSIAFSGDGVITQEGGGTVVVEKGLRNLKGPIL